MQVRKVVTGHDAERRAVIARDEKIDGMPISGLGELVFLWSADESATYPNSGDNPAAPAPVIKVVAGCRGYGRGYPVLAFAIGIRMQEQVSSDATSRAEQHLFDQCRESSHCLAVHS